ncbi:hypothetical protein CCR85_02405 [Rhodothalassium salexigens]|uniref:PAS domain-containing protein n=1 Tax=Rhodothalassium salexigens TaxID=1086 RepID=UPI001914125B|nr:hypothetical protein [Rhodothalassium salexigens]
MPDPQTDGLTKADPDPTDEPPVIWSAMEGLSMSRRDNVRPAAPPAHGSAAGDGLSNHGPPHHGPWTDQAGNGLQADTASTACSIRTTLAAEQIGDPRLVDLFSLWSSRRAGCGLPARSGFSHRDLFPWMGQLYLFAVTAPPVTFTATLIGTHLVSLLGRDITGITYRLDNCPDETVELCELLCAAYCAGDAVYLRSTVGDLPGALHKLALPCAEDGKTVDTMLCCAYAERSLIHSLKGRGLVTGSLQPPLG